MIAQLYPQALAQLELARKHKSTMSREWNSALSGGLVTESVVIESDGRGRVVGHINRKWRERLRDELTTNFRDCIQALWSALDCLVVETAEAFSVQHRLKDPERPRFFPVADSPDAFDALLDQSVLDGVLRPHYQIIRDCQPFQKCPGANDPDRMQAAIRQLVTWENDINDGAAIEPWATSVDPRVMAEDPILVESVTPQPPGILRDERLLATFQLSQFQRGSVISATSGTYVDLCFPKGFVPSGRDDTFELRLREVIDAVGLFAIYFSYFSDQVKGARRVLTTPNGGVTDQWVSAKESSRNWSADELESISSSGGLGQVIGAGELTLIITTPDGVYERVIPRASPLRQLERPGLSVEAAIRDAAATWGMPDFVMRPTLEKKGAGVREIGDGLLVVGKQGIIVQAKTREGQPGSDNRERSWINKQIAAGVRQLEGTGRRLRSDQTHMLNGRGYSIRIDGPSIQWGGVVVIDHPRPPTDFAPTSVVSRVPVVVLLRRDWEFLFNQLRSTHAVVSYLLRVGKPTELLGTEPERYFGLAAADAAASPSPIDSRIAAAGSVKSAPLLPTAPAGSDDADAHGMVRMMLEDLATTDFDAEKRGAVQDVLASVDTLPVAHRTELGRLLLDSLRLMRQVEDGTIAWRFRTYLAGPNDVQLGFGVCSQFNETIRLAFQSWLLLRHYERGDRFGVSNELTSIGILLTPRRDGLRDWDTTMISVQGSVEISDDDLERFRDLWNREGPNSREDR